MSEHGRNEPVVMQGTYSDLKVVKGRGVCQVVVEFPLEHMERFVAMFGAPKMGDGRWVAIALMNEKPEGMEDRQAVTSQDKVVQRCVMMCKDEQFARWLCRTPDLSPRPSENEVVEELYRELKIDSRKEIGTNPAVKQRWLDLVAEYEGGPQ